jgi:REP element-mobilizing transposase RayT
MQYDSQKRDRHALRLKAWDYCRWAAYFVTLCTEDHQCLFGKVVRGRMHPNAYGRIVVEEWHRTAEVRDEVRLDAFVVMPNHVHGIILLTPPKYEETITPHAYDISMSRGDALRPDGRKDRSHSLWALPSAPSNRPSRAVSTGTANHPAQRCGSATITTASCATKTNGATEERTSTTTRENGRTIRITVTNTLIAHD